MATKQKQFKDPTTGERVVAINAVIGIWLMGIGA